MSNRTIGWRAAITGTHSAQISRLVPMPWLNITGRPEVTQGGRKSEVT
jgi:hypothetical protein